MLNKILMIFKFTRYQSHLQNIQTSSIINPTNIYLLDPGNLIIVSNIRWNLAWRNN